MMNLMRLLCPLANRKQVRVAPFLVAARATATIRPSASKREGQVSRRIQKIAKDRRSVVFSPGSVESAL